MAPRSLLIAQLLAALLALTAASPASATFKGALGKIVYWDPRPHDGTQQPMLVDDPTDDQPAQELGRGFKPVWSPDGTQIAYELYEHWELDDPYNLTHGTEGIGVMKADATGKRQIVETPQREVSSAGCQRPCHVIWWSDGNPAWSADGESVYFLRTREGSISSLGDQDLVQLRRASLSGGDSLIQTYDLPYNGLRGLVASPDGTKLLSTRRVVNGGSDAVILDAQTGAMMPVPGTHGVTGSIYGADWAPDSKHIVVTFNLGSGQTVAKVMLLDGTVIQSFPVGDRFPRFSPDGSHLVTQQACTGDPNDEGSCSLVSTLIDDPIYDPDADIRPDEPREESIDASTTRASFDIQPQRQPIIFIHGFAGSRIACEGNELWPPTPLAIEDDLLDMRLADDGVSPHPSGCDAQATGILRKALGPFGDVYDSALKFLEDIAPDDHHVLFWDWRKDPRLQRLALNTLIRDALDRPLQKAQGVTKVVLVGHSMGGLVIRDYIDDPARAEKVARAVTIGTPYWGAPKAIFPLAAGIETPGFSALDLILPNRQFREFARNLTGAYFLYPSENYGGWLSVNGFTPSPFDRPALESYVARLGGNRSLLARGLNAHRDELDGFKEHEIDYRVFVGTGLSTIGKVRLIPGPSGEAGSVAVQWTNGDGTVPARSGTQGPIGTADPLGDNVPISYVCKVGHVPLPGHPAVTGAIRDFLLYGTLPRKTEPHDTKGVCLAESDEVIFKNIDLADEAPLDVTATRVARASAQASTSIQDAEAQGLLQLLELSDEAIAVIDDDTPVDVTVQANGARMAVTPLSNEDRGAPVYYGPITGELTLSRNATGTVTVLDDGAPVEPRTQPEAGDPVTGTSPPPPPSSDVDSSPPPAPGGDPTPPSTGPAPPVSNGSPSGRCKRAQRAVGKAKKKLKKARTRKAKKRARSELKKALRRLRAAC